MGKLASAYPFANSVSVIGTGGSNSVVESQPSKLLVAGSIPVSRSSLRSQETRACFGLASQPPREGGPTVARNAKVDIRDRSLSERGRLVGRSGETQM